MAKHAFLSASASHRWINCPPSAKLCEGIKDESSHYAQEGTDCHELCAYLVEMALGRDVEDPTENLTYYSGEMQNCAEEYRDYVLEQFERSKKFCSDPMVFIEQRLDFSRWVENGFGTGDCVIIADEVLHIIDYKHGLGVLTLKVTHIFKQTIISSFSSWMINDTLNHLCFFFICHYSSSISFSQYHQNALLQFHLTA